MEEKGTGTTFTPKPELHVHHTFPHQIRLGELKCLKMGTLGTLNG